ncbi:MAG: DoxX family membrane protein [Chitinophagaceae bacterium]|nr:DoxX family membrane protein [Chitinophagaceae bacterium]
MKALIQFFRVATGVLFIISGLVKANDPWGLAYKMNDYFSIWHLPALHDYSLYLSVGMNVFEVVAGVALLIGWAPRLITRLLLLLIIFFTFLTGYAVITGTPKTCGCFGDCLPIAPWQSFSKDLVLLLMIAVLLKHADEINPLMPLRARLFVVLFCTGLVFFGQLQAIRHLPYVDCLPYAKGKNLLQQMDPPPGSVPDSMSIMFTYKQKSTGKTIRFDVNNFPADYSDSAYEYVSRDEVLVRKGNAEPAIKDLALRTLDRVDTTRELLSSKGRYLLFFAKDFDGSAGWLELFGKLHKIATEQKVPLLAVSNQPEVLDRFLNGVQKLNTPVLGCDGTVMKTFLRSKTGLIAMNGAVVAGKWAEPDMNNAVPWIQGR